MVEEGRKVRLLQMGLLWGLVLVVLRTAIQERGPDLELVTHRASPVRVIRIRPALQQVHRLQLRRADGGRHLEGVRSAWNRIRRRVQREAERRRERLLSVQLLSSHLLHHALSIREGESVANDGHHVHHEVLHHFHVELLPLHILFIRSHGFHHLDHASLLFLSYLRTRFVK